MNKKGFTLIELIVVMAVLAILVILATPMFKGQVAEANKTLIINDINVLEGELEIKQIKGEEIPKGAEITKSELETELEKGKLYGIGGLLKDKSEIEGNTFREVVNKQSKLTGKFISNEEEKVYYLHGVGGTGEPETGGPAEPEEGGPETGGTETGGTEPTREPGTPDKEGYILARETDFTWVVESGGYDFPGQTKRGYWRYKGTDEKIEIPHKINGTTLTSYYRMFNGGSSGSLSVKSTNLNVTSMLSMFKDSQATTLDLSSFNTSNVTIMSYMFNGSQATTLNLSSFNTSNVTDMGVMFRNSQATTLNLSSFNTSNVTDMGYMFDGSQATTIDLSSFDTSNAINMGGMFRDSKATTLNLSSFNTSNITNMNQMFYDSKATTLDLSSFNTSKVTDMSEMFFGSQATTLDLSSFDTSNVKNMIFMFKDSQATTLDLSSFNTSNITNMNDMYCMFEDSQATTGYARTKAEANKFNKISLKPAGLTFVVK